MKGTPQLEIDKKVTELLDIVGLKDFANKMIYEMSGGMQTTCSFGTLPGE